MIAIPLHPHAFETADAAAVAPTVPARSARRHIAAASRLRGLVSRILSIPAQRGASHDRPVGECLRPIPLLAVGD